jgi:hypothetical protein
MTNNPPFAAIRNNPPFAAVRNSPPFAAIFSLIECSQQPAYFTVLKEMDHQILKKNSVL